MKSEGELKITDWGSFYRECELYQQISIVKDKAFNTETNNHRTISVEKDIKRLIYPRYISEISEDKVKQIIKKVIESIANDVSETLTNKILCNITNAN